MGQVWVYVPKETTASVIIKNVNDVQRRWTQYTQKTSYPKKKAKNHETSKKKKTQQKQRIKKKTQIRIK